MLDDLGAAIEEHSHVDEDLSNDKFWESLYEKHWDEYAAETAHPSFSDFQVYCDEKGLVPGE